MTIGSGIAIAAIWIAVTTTIWITRKDASPFGHFMFVVVAAWATTFVAGGH